MKALKFYSLLLAGALSFFLGSCQGEGGNRDNSTTTVSNTEGVQMIAGDDSKTWTMRREFNAAGHRENTTKEEREEKLVFNADKTFSVHNTYGTSAGTWTYSNGTLNLTYTNTGVVESYAVEELSGNKMRLRDAGGVEVVLKED